MTTTAHAVASDRLRLRRLLDQVRRGETDAADFVLLADLGRGHSGRIVDVWLEPGERLTPVSPLRPGTLVEVLETREDGARHVRIGFREYAIPAAFSRRIVIRPEPVGEPEAVTEGQGADACYEIVLSKQSRGIWRLLVVRRDNGSVVSGRTFDDTASARQARDELREEARTLTPVEFRERHQLP
jgi:hypothetical protein